MGWWGGLPSGGLDRGPRWLGLAAAGSTLFLLLFVCFLLFSSCPFPCLSSVFASLSLLPLFVFPSFFSFCLSFPACFRVAFVGPLFGVWFSLCKLASLPLTLSHTRGLPLSGMAPPPSSHSLSFSLPPSLFLTPGTRSFLLRLHRRLQPLHVFGHQPVPGDHRAVAGGRSVPQHAPFATGKWGVIESIHPETC